MVKRLIIGLVSIAMHCAVAVAAVTHDETRPGVATYRQWRYAAAQTLAARAEVDQLTAAAAVGYLGGADHDAALAWAARAAQLKPDDAAIGWLRLELCAGTPTCDIRDAAITLRWIDADNAAAWLPSLAVAVRDQDPMEIDRILTEMAVAGHFDLYWNRLVALLFDVLRRERDALPEHYTGSDVARLSEAISVLSAESIPPFAALQTTCRDAAGERREACLHIAKTMQHGDTIVTQLAGLGIERRSLPIDSRELRVLAERRRTLIWRRAAANRFEITALPWLKNSQARSLVSRMRMTPREEDVYAAVLRAHGIALEPPAGHR